MSILGKFLPSSSGQGMSKRLLVLFLTAFVMPSLALLETPEWIIQGIGQLAAIFIGGKSVSDAARDFRKPAA